MAHSLQTHFRRRRMQRWIRREALLLEREARQFDCFEATTQARELIEIAEGRAGFIYELRTA